MSGKPAPRVRLTDRAIPALPNAPQGKRMMVRDETQPNLAIRITDKGVKTFVVYMRVKGRKAPVTHIIGTYPSTGLALARIRAKEVAELLASGIIPSEEKKRAAEFDEAQKASTFEAVAKEFAERHLVKNRSRAESERILDTYLIPRFGQMQMRDIKRSDIARLLDELETRKYQSPNGRAKGGPVMADRVLSCLGKLTRWYAARDEDYVLPIVSSMARTNPKERARDRVLTDHELRALWAALDELEHKDQGRNVGDKIYSALIRMLLLTAQRRDEVAEMERSEVSGNGLWSIPDHRYKTKKPHVVPLSQSVVELLANLPKVGDCPFTFSTNGKDHFSGFSKAKVLLDQRMLTYLRADAEQRGETGLIFWVDKIIQLKADAAKGDQSARDQLKKDWWTLHDLRRTGRTLLARSGVSREISERVVGHTMQGVEAIYNRWDYVDEKRQALETLANKILEIVEQPKRA